MNREEQISEFIRDFSYEQLPAACVNTVKYILLSVLGAAMAGFHEDGCEEIRGRVLAWGGARDASLFFGAGQAPAHTVALANGVVCRALDYCDAMAPGIHMGSSIVPVALALAEQRGGCSGREFISALAAGAEIGSRFNLTESEYHGFDPTGVAGVFAATTAACKMLGLDKDCIVSALGLAFNRAGGSFQSNVDGSLAVRLIQGWVAESGIVSAELSKAGITGPRNFIDGVYGYRQLFAAGAQDDRIAGDLGRTYRLQRTMFKQFPSCGLTQGVTELTLKAIASADITTEMIRGISVRVPPYAHRLVGHTFKIGTTPRVDAQFSIQYCVANALIRGSSQLDHFTPKAIRDRSVNELARRVEVVPDPAMDARGHTAVDLDISLASGAAHHFELDHPGGFPDNPLSEEAHVRRFEDCVRYSSVPGAANRGPRLLDAIMTLDKATDIGELVDAVTSA